MGPGISHDACKLARIPRVIKKKIIMYVRYIQTREVHLHVDYTETQ